MRSTRLIGVVRDTECFRWPRRGTGFAAVGDATTSGRSAPTLGLLGKTSWVAHLAKDGCPYCFCAARANQDATEIKSQIAEALSYRPDAVVIVAGTKEVFGGRPPGDIAELIDEMSSQIEAATAVPIVATLPPYHERPEQVANMNSAVTELARRRRLGLIDFYGALSEDGRFRPGLTVDGLHPSREGARAMAEAARPVVLASMA